MWKRRRACHSGGENRSFGLGSGRAVSQLLALGAKWRVRRSLRCAVTELSKALAAREEISSDHADCSRHLEYWGWFLIFWQGKPSEVSKGTRSFPRPGAKEASDIAASDMSGGRAGGWRPGGALRADSQEATGAIRHEVVGLSSPAPPNRMGRQASCHCGSVGGAPRRVPHASRRRGSTCCAVHVAKRGGHVRRIQDTLQPPRQDRRIREAAWGSARLCRLSKVLCSGVKILEVIHSWHLVGSPRGNQGPLNTVMD